MGQDDRSSGSRTLPLAELNPLLNPLLAENMGRWAEVYFTSPPERREQAVIELLRELEAERSRQDDEESNPASDLRMVRAPVKAVAQIRCDACGRENPESNKYCGICGAGLGEATAYSIFRDHDPRATFDGQDYPPRSSAEQRSAEDEQIETSPQEQPETQYQHETQYDEENRNGSYPVSREFGRPSNGNGLSLFQAPAETGSDESVDWADEPEPSPPHRYYIAGVLAVIILVLGYMAIHGTQASQNMHEVSAPPPAAANDTAAAPAPAATATTPPPASTAKTAEEEPPQPAARDASARTSPPEDVQKNPPKTKGGRPGELAQFNLPG